MQTNLIILVKFKKIQEVKMIKLIIGPMRSGKSLLLLREAEKLHLSNKKYILLRPVLDTREFISRSFKPTINLNIGIYRNKSLFSKRRVLEHDYILLDEFHLFDKSILKLLLNYNKNVIISGLSTGFNNENERKIELLENIHAVLPYADEIIKLNAICEDCGSMDGNFSLSNSGKIEISDNYKVLCLKCLRKYNINSDFLYNKKDLAEKILENN